MVTTKNLQGQYAGFASRAVALVIDFAIISVALLAVNWFVASFLGMLNMQVSDCVQQVTGQQKGTDFCNLVASVSLIFALCFAPVYFIFFWIVGDGTTPGHAIMGLRVVRMSAKPMRLHIAVLRWIGYIVCFLSFGLGFVGVLLDNQRQGWHDTLAGTCVLYTRPVQSDEAAVQKWRTRLQRRQHTEAAVAAVPADFDDVPEGQPVATEMTRE